MHDLRLRAQARSQFLAGSSIAQVARQFGLPYPTVWHWCNDRPEPARMHSSVRCFRCDHRPVGAGLGAAYAYLLGLYLGDGHLVTSARVPVLRIYCSTAWPRLIDVGEAAIREVLARSVQRVVKQGCTVLQSYSSHWPCLLPQHGPGKKHERSIALAGWQHTIVGRHHGDLLRGLFHSDGCRVTNSVRKGRKTYVYPRYMFTNESTDIMALCQTSLDALGIPWRMNRPNSLSVARRDAVTALDQHVGPKG
ncbi:transcriptional regulator [Plantactinospora sp. KBS50]|uniref:transcriptional regulator n=1 Tax=Plantactinospora sp. KBS50 TaxID=2024580 RepID=UPI000BAAC4E2|nr:transcriptional regulator [Plantactinospora sp. KBS50]ASW55972.1 transcriptional regulator [Plantactinospora sp. KBS50]